MNKISAPGHFRTDSSQSLLQSIMMLDARDRAAADGSSSRIVSIAIRDKLPIMNGLPGCEAEIHLTMEQAASFAHTLLVLAEHSESVGATLRTHNTVRTLA